MVHIDLTKCVTECDANQVVVSDQCTTLSSNTTSASEGSGSTLSARSIILVTGRGLTLLRGHPFALRV